MSTPEQPIAAQIVVPAAPPPALSQAQAAIEYDRLTGAFKYLIKLAGIFITLLTSAFGLLFWSNLKDARHDAVEAANDSARKAVAAALGTPNIQKIIDAEVQARTREKVDAQIQETLGGKIAEFQKEQKQISEAVILSSLSRSLSGYGGGTNPDNLRKLDDLMYDSHYESVRELARDGIQQLALEYDKESGSFNPMIYKPNALGYLSNQPNGEATFALLSKRNADMFELYKAFVDLKRLTGWKVDTFDIRGGLDWCGRHDCKLSTPTR